MRKIVPSALWIVVLTAAAPGLGSAAEEEKQGLVLRKGVEGLLQTSDPLLPGKGHYRTIRYRAEGSEPITIRLESRFFNAYLLVRDGKGKTVAEDDDGGLGDGSEVTFRPESGEEYSILAASADEENIGIFRLMVQSGRRTGKLTADQEARLDRFWYETTLKWEIPLSRKLQLWYALGGLHSKMGDHEKAQEVWEEGLKAARQAGRRQEEGLFLGILGKECWDLGQPERAIEYFEEALASYQATGNRSKEGWALYCLGAAYSKINQQEKAIDFFKKAISVLKETKSLRIEGFALRDLGAVYYSLGRLEKAIEFLEKSLDIYKEARDRRGEGTALGDLGAVYSSLGRSRKAIIYYEEALAIHKETGNRLGEGIVLCNLGIHHSKLGQEEKAVELYQRALAVHEESGNRQIAASVLGHLGIAFDKLGQPEKAIEKYDEALAIHRENMNRRGEGIVLLNQGGVWGRIGQAEKAAESLKMALAIFKETKDRRNLAIAALCFGSMHARRGREDLALKAFRDAHSIGVSILEGLEGGLEESAIRSFAASDATQDVSPYLSLLLKMIAGEPSVVGKEALLWEALGLVEEVRTRTLVSSMRAGEVRDLLGPVGRRILDRIMFLRKQTSEMVSELAPPREPSEPRAAALERSQDEIDALERRLKATEPRYARLSSTFDVASDRLASLVEKGEILLEYSFLGEKVSAFLWDSTGGLEVKVVESGKKDLEAETQQVLAKIRERGPIEDLKPCLRGLRRKLFHGFEERIGKKERLLVVPDGILDLLPFEALVLEDGRYLVEKSTIRYGPSLQALSELKGGRGRDGDVELVLYGDPEFGGAGGTKTEVADSLRIRGATAFAKLAFAAKEMEAVGSLFDRKLVRKGREATEQGFKREAGKGTVLHVATHGRFSRGPQAKEDEPGDPLFYTGIAFQGCNEGGDGEEDGFLSAGEVLGLDLRGVDLAVLSACQTASGEVQGQEGKFGLERAFFIAGVKSFVGSLWSVNDQATSEFMRRFYGYLRKGEGRADSLRRVKLEFIRGLYASRPGTRQRQGEDEPSGERGLKLVPRGADVSHPYFWAPFILSGEGAGL
jgi:CHAT domain-containing protein/Tfp pilus assembly protein PilF